MKYIEIEGKNEATAKVDFVNPMEINCEVCNTSCTFEDVNISGVWGESNTILVCDDCDIELALDRELEN